MNSIQLAKTIIDQMGGQGRLKAMVGAHTFLHGSGGVTFQFKGSSKFNTCVVKLDAMDTYTMKLGKYDRGTGDYEVKAEFEGLYCDMLKSVFEEATGLRLSL
jgi:hypothetical protein